MILLLGVTGAIALPLVRLMSSVRIVTNIDGIEWRRGKWQGLVERIAVRTSRFVGHSMYNMKYRSMYPKYHVTISA